MTAGNHSGSVAFFIPHLGCPHSCIFCDQRHISGHTNPPEPGYISSTLRAVLATRPEAVPNMQIAFFGGSFTAIDKRLRKMLLEEAAHFCGEGGFAGVRFSTRPDCINEEILRELSDYPVTDIELGAQSMSDYVLAESERGHTAAETRLASWLIKNAGYNLTLQMMTGLPGDTTEISRQTAEELAALKPDAVRIYPTLVLQGTMLEKKLLRGEYQPQSLDEAITQCACLLRFFTDKHINVLRVGLHDSEGVAKSWLAGPHHPAFRELCEGEAMISQIMPIVRTLPKGAVRLRVRSKSISALTGHGRRALKPLEAEGYFPIVIGDDSFGYLQINA